MKLFIDKTAAVTDIRSMIAAVLAIALILWVTGLPSWLSLAHAGELTPISDTLSDSDLSQTSDHAFAFTLETALDQSDTIVFLFDPDTSLFTINNLAATDVTSESGLDVVAACGGGSNELTMATTSTTVTLTVCAGDSVTAAAKTLTFDNLRITNPGVQDSYVIRVSTTNDGSTVRDTSDTRVAIVNDVTVTASVDTIFDFTVDAVAIGLTVNGAGTTTATTTTATSIPFGTLTPNVPKVAAQTLAVTTNASGGFTVTVVQDNNLLSATGADIDLFIDGSAEATPAPWQAPAGTIGTEDTYGHIGVTSEDQTLSGGDTFGNALFAGNFNTPLEVFYHDDVADGSVAHEGTTRVAFEIEIDSLQEAGTDYTNTLTYVATPIF